MLRTLAVLALAGALGTVARYALSVVAERGFHLTSSGATAFVNVVGCLLAGALFAVLERYGPGGAAYQKYLFIGFLGAFTTFSAYSLEAGRLLESGNLLGAALHIAVHNGLGIVAVLTGLLLGQTLL